MYTLHTIKATNCISIEFYKKLKTWIFEGTKFYSKLYQTIYLWNSANLLIFYKNKSSFLLIEPALLFAKQIKLFMSLGSVPGIAKE